ATEEQDWTGLPVIFDEVFTGINRLGRFSAATFLKVHPDISVYAKLLTGGLIPLCLTMASQSVFNAFLSEDKTDALLHGHSYTAHAVGCEVALRSMQIMDSVTNLKTGPWSEWRKAWLPTTNTLSPDQTLEENNSDQKVQVWSMWSQQFVRTLSHKEQVDNIFAIGCVLAISLRDPLGSGYTSTAAAGLQKRLLADEAERGWVIHSRVLGNVLYLMTSLTAKLETVRAVEAFVESELA
ncbi:hypothetical protein LTS18_012946, partial [Coniosporium uncinatum]